MPQSHVFFWPCSCTKPIPPYSSRITVTATAQSDVYARCCNQMHSLNTLYSKVLHTFGTRSWSFTSTTSTYSPQNTKGGPTKAVRGIYRLVRPISSRPKTQNWPMMPQNDTKLLYRSCISTRNRAVRMIGIRFGKKSF